MTFQEADKRKELMEKVTKNIVREMNDLTEEERYVVLNAAERLTEAGMNDMGKSGWVELDPTDIPAYWQLGIM